MAYKRLPASDRYGNFWLGHKMIPADPAIFPSKELCKDGVRQTGTWLAFLGSDGGFVYEGPNLKRFASPEEALREINRSL